MAIFALRTREGALKQSFTSIKGLYILQALDNVNGFGCRKNMERWRKKESTIKQDFKRNTILKSKHCDNHQLIRLSGHRTVRYDGDEETPTRLVLFPCGGKLTFHMKWSDHTGTLRFTGVTAPVLSGHAANVQPSHIPVLLHYHPSAIRLQWMPIFLPLSLDRPWELADELSRLVFDHPKVLHVAHHFNYGIWGWGQGSGVKGSGLGHKI